MNDMPLFAEPPVLPYAGTSGWAGSTTSKERAVRNDSDGTTGRNQRTTVEHLVNAGTRGLTWKELGDLTGWHHGTASGALSVLHKAGTIARLTERRNRCAVYVLPICVVGRATSEHKATAGTRKANDLLDGIEADLFRGDIASALSRIAKAREAGN